MIKSPEVGQEIVYLNPLGGSEKDITTARKHLNLGQTYTIKEVFPHNWVTFLCLREVPSVNFNSVLFESKKLAQGVDLDRIIEDVRIVAEFGSQEYSVSVVDEQYMVDAIRLMRGAIDPAREFVWFFLDREAEPGRKTKVKGVPVDVWIVVQRGGKEFKQSFLDKFFLGDFLLDLVDPGKRSPAVRLADFLDVHWKRTRRMN